MIAWNSDATYRRNCIDFFYLRNGDVELNAGVHLVVPAQVQANTYNSDGDNIVLLLRNGDAFIRFRKTQDDITISKDVKGVNLTVSGKVNTNTIDSNGVAIIVLKRNGVDVFRLNGTELLTEPNVHFISQGQVKSNLYNSNGNNNVGFYRFGTEYIKLNATPATVSLPCVEIATGVGLTSNIIWTDDHRCKNDNVDTKFWGGN